MFLHVTVSRPTNPSDLRKAKAGRSWKSTEEMRRRGQRDIDLGMSWSERWISSDKKRSTGEMSDSGSEVSRSGNMSRMRPTAGRERPVEERRVSTETTEEMGAARREGFTLRAL